MLNHTTVEGLKSLRLPAMAAGLAQQREHPDYSGLSFEERLGLLVDAELLQRQNRRRERVLKAAKLRSPAVVEDVDFTKTRGLDKTAFLSLVNSPWVDNHHGVMIVGPTGVGKTFIACALANDAIRHGHSALYVRVPRLLDDLLLRPLSDDQAADLLEVVEDRRGRSIIATSQLPIDHWHEGLGDATIADAIMDRLLQRTHRIELTGASRRRSDTTAPRTRQSPT